jgi:hypothetical protein
MAWLAEQLSNQVGGPVADATASPGSDGSAIRGAEHSRILLALLRIENLVKCFK